ncbi:maleylpyruvate isomerase N-terminal domain-containing protein [Aeromicrobium sp. NPDC092404]|uniref:maleylpyruvate isomerase N-terminal domain-containing protein n=1 Tax=Aeromicrobium sp. NPDC092404 TaxID=3154976 RepID=UPI00342C5114
MVTNEELLRSQWAALRGWIESSGLLRHAQQQSVLEAWNVHELVTHVGRSFLDLPVLGPAPDARAQSIREYISDYGASARDIADGTKQLARSFANDVLAGIDNCARLGFRALDALQAEVVRGPRGAITRDDFVLTRVIELVVHGDDLGRSVPEVPAPPLLDGPVAAVSAALAEAYVEVAGRQPEIGDPLAWIRVATGRIDSPDAALPLL